MEDHKGSAAYKTAVDATEYDNHKNVTISRYQKVLYTMAGDAVPDNYTANHKCKTGLFPLFMTQLASYEVGNGVTFGEKTTKERFGEDIDTTLYEGVKKALVQGVAFGFYNLDHIEFYGLTEFVPLWDEHDGSLKAGIRFWQLADNRPKNYTLFELDGYTDFTTNDDGEVVVKNEKRGYKQIVSSSPADGEQILAYENYPAFPVVPLWGNVKHQSEMEGRREQIDCYDLIKSGFANDLDDASMIYWVLQNAGGMDDIDLAKFIERMKVLKAAVVDGDNGARAEAHTMDVPYQGREAYLNRLEKDLYKDFMALDVEAIAAGAVTATQIKAAYEPLNEKADELEMCLFKFFKAVFKVAGIKDSPVFTRSQISNIGEEVQTVAMAVPFIGEEEATRRVCGILGISDKFEDIMKAKQAEEMERFQQQQMMMQPPKQAPGGEEE